jgi:hypothetical protein
MDVLTGRSIRPHGLLLTSDAREEGWSSALHSAARRGDLFKVRPGVYLPQDGWHALTPEVRYLVRIHAVALTFRHPVFARQSAAALHGLPLLRGRMHRIHTYATTPSGSGRRGDVTVHAGVGDPDMVERHGLRVTSAERTVLDLVRTLPHPEALAIADAAVRSPASEWDGTGMPLCSRTDLVDAAAAQVAARGGWAAYLVVSAADPASGSVGESVSRSVFIRLGAPEPELQAAMRDDQGLIGYADFFWREYGVVGEFDGRLKYGADNPSGRAPEDVVYREKLREDRIRRVVRQFIRFGWGEANDPPRMARLLVDAGVPLDRASAWPALRPLVPRGSVVR